MKSLKAARDISWVFAQFKLSWQSRQISLICLILSKFKSFKYIKILILKICFILEWLKSTLRTFSANFEVLGINTKHFSKIRQICLICQIHFAKTRMSYIVEFNHAYSVIRNLSTDQTLISSRSNREFILVTDVN